MKKRLFKLALSALGELIAKLPPQKAKEVLDDMIDGIEKRIADSPNKIDDALLQPTINFMRRVLDIPDDVGGDED